MTTRAFLNVDGQLSIYGGQGDAPSGLRGAVYVDVPNALIEQWDEASKARTQAEIAILFHTMTRLQYEQWVRSIEPWSSGSPWIALRYHLIGAWRELVRLFQGTIDDEGRRHPVGWFYRINGVLPWQYCGARSSSHRPEGVA